MNIGTRDGDEYVGVAMVCVAMEGGLSSSISAWLCGNVDRFRFSLSYPSLRQEVSLSDESRFELHMAAVTIHAIYYYLRYYLCHYTAPLQKESIMTEHGDAGVV